MLIHCGDWRERACPVQSCYSFLPRTGTLFFFDEAAIVLQQYESISGSKYTLRIYHSFFPCSGQGSRLTKKELLIFLP